jgi:hypothetical protein
MADIQFCSGCRCQGSSARWSPQYCASSLSFFRLEPHANEKRKELQ